MVGLISSFALASCQGSSPEARSQDEPSMREAVLYAYAPYQFALNMDRLRVEQAQAGVDINQIAHNRDLADYTSRNVTTPNTDTIYSSAILDLGAEPIEVTLPQDTDRYVSVMLMDIFSDVVAYLDHEARENDDRKVWIVGPEWAGQAPDGVAVVQSPSADAWLLGRIFVVGPEDLPQARAIQSQLTITPVNPVAPFQSRFTDLDDTKTKLMRVNEMLGRAPGHPQAARASQFADFGIVPDDVDQWSALSLRQRVVWGQAFKRVETGLKDAVFNRAIRAGWTESPKNLGRYGPDDETRAAVSLIGFGAMTREEAIYFSSETDAMGQALTGERAYTLTLYPEGVPVDGFWSLSVYQVMPDGQRFFIDNPINRYAVNNATPGLVRDETGAVSFLLTSEEPAQSENWLPTPKGPFALVFRTYGPQDPVLTGQWTPPEIQPQP
jgi:hypothetical protein